MVYHYAVRLPVIICCRKAQKTCISKLQNWKNHKNYASGTIGIQVAKLQFFCDEGLVFLSAYSKSIKSTILERPYLHHQFTMNTFLIYKKRAINH